MAEQFLTLMADLDDDSLRTLVKSFHPFMARITRLHLCAFWPTREIAFVRLQ